VKLYQFCQLVIYRCQDADISRRLVPRRRRYYSSTAPCWSLPVNVCHVTDIGHQSASGSSSLDEHLHSLRAHVGQINPSRNKRSCICFRQPVAENREIKIPAVSYRKRKYKPNVLQISPSHAISVVFTCIQFALVNIMFQLGAVPVALTASTNDSPVHVLMLSCQVNDNKTTTYIAP